MSSVDPQPSRTIWTVVRDMLMSKKFLTMISGVIVAGAAKIGLEMSADTVALLIAPIISYVLGQGVADIGKNLRSDF